MRPSGLPEPTPQACSLASPTRRIDIMLAQTSPLPHLLVCVVSLFAKVILHKTSTGAETVIVMQNRILLGVILTR